MPVREVIVRLPGISMVRDRCRAMAVLDAIMSPEWQYRYYFFDSRWSADQEMASMRDGSGNDYSIVFSPAGACGRGFDHESAMSPYRVSPPAPWPGLLDAVPGVLRPQIAESAFCDDGTPRVTVCFWRERDDTAWRCGTPAAPPRGADDGGAGWLFDVLADGRPEAYQRFAEAYYEVPVQISAVRHVYALRPLTPDVVVALNPGASLPGLSKDLGQIGYP